MKTPVRLSARMESAESKSCASVPKEIVDAVESVLGRYVSPDRMEKIRKTILSEDLDQKPELSQDSLMTTEQLSKHLHVSRVTLFRYVKAGKLRAYKMGRRNLFSSNEVQAALKGRIEMN